MSLGAAPRGIGLVLRDVAEAGARRMAGAFGAASEGGATVLDAGFSTGHATGADGARLIVELLDEMARRGLRSGAAVASDRHGSIAAVIVET
jgi:acetyl-CoA acetyltransferase